MGDYNTKPYEPQYKTFSAQYQDLWATVHPAEHSNSTYIFNISMDNKPHLENAAASNLISAFQGRNATLTASATITRDPDTVDNVWRIVDGARIYRVEEVGEQLLVYDEAKESIGYTFDSVNPYQRIDFLFRSLDFGTRVLSCEVLFDEHGSDHLPMWAEIAWV